MAKKSSFLSMTLTLTLICLVCSALLGFVYSFTEKPIKNAEVAKKNSAISVVLPQFTNVPSEEEQTLEMDGKEYKVYTAKNGEDIIGYAIESVSAGFGGPIKLMIGITVDGIIHNISVLSHAETPGLGDKIDPRKSNFPEQFKGMNPAQTNMAVTKDGGDIDAITAATISSRAYIEAVKSAVALYNNVITK